MKEYVNLLFSIINEINDWELKKIDQKKEIIKLYINGRKNYDFYVDYFEKYRKFLTKNTFKNLTKDILTH